jgi:transcriptional regulator with XRE-family HTH domain
MAKRLQEKRERALALRKEQLMSYSQIKEILKVSKSSLSLWLKNYPLSPERINELRGNNERRIERYRETRRKIREARLQRYYLEQQKNLFPLSKKEILIAGLFLYWGEGSKSKPTEVFVSNTNPAVISFFIYWLKNVFNIPRKDIRFRMHFYEDMDVKKETVFWAKTLRVSETQFSKPYIKKSSSLRINEKGSFGHGTCNAGIYDARLCEQILMALKAIANAHMVP